MADLSWEVRVGDSRDLLRELPDASVDAIVCDPPYELGFMGKAWDSSGIAYSVPLWAEVLRVLRPGGHLLAFGGSRTYHRMACAIEDAGFQIRDSLVWIYGSGFPKSLDVSKAIDKQRNDRDQVERVVRWLDAARRANGVSKLQVEQAFGTKNICQGLFSVTPGSTPRTPSMDQVPLLLATIGIDEADVPNDIRELLVTLNSRKRQPGDAWGERAVTGQYLGDMGGLAGTRLGGRGKPITTPATDAARQWNGWGTALKPAQEPIVMARKPLAGTIAETVLQYGTGAINVDGCRVPHAGADDLAAHAKGVAAITAKGGSMDGSCKNSSDLSGANDVSAAGRWPANVLLGHSEACGDGCAEGCPVAELGDFARFFYAAKPSTRERDAGLEHMPMVAGHEVCDREEGSAGASHARAGVRTQRRNIHPTVKPIEIMRYLVRLVTPPGGLVLDPFAGSGTTGCAAVLEGKRFLGLELEPAHAEIARARIAHWAPKQAELWPAAE